MAALAARGTGLLDDRATVDEARLAVRGVIRVPDRPFPRLGVAEVTDGSAESMVIDDGRPTADDGPRCSSARSRP
ncbi:hypothetical protein ACSL103130_03270 [Actinomyces slackii]|uniref:Uncharacterized protein n=1 Tax=Actinomyces slackii TaxID=52774 RepID=A0A3S4SP89_9ACTO|nr:Uncharacterised protein [Actinomyces slackii]